ncbi:DEAD/DEAH box helicase [Methanobrevibacter sp. TMH8]|uniref:UvrD-helicase domain-containing protein n=1 Tax=Methanobrevibacter sp. TMH8 TaxID=2848611 RepID=UPI001CCCD023|nr:DEAD/DEAH box helicase [Methanobrevibacter sp. TMH8]MBZ9570906.1 DEAD/DEAH box helicase [Methanobrevibacter sp. TMH8]
MISYSQFENIVVNELKRDISSNKDQQKAISSEKDQSLFIVAGPGSGKTTVMVLKILKFIFVDDINPNEILATTFTRKAANELNSRILSWGDEIKKHLYKTLTDKKKINQLNRIDFNQIITGTIDSIAEEILRIHRDPGTNLPAVIEDFVSNSAMISSGLFNKDRYLDKDLQKYLGTINSTEEVKNPSTMSNLLLDIKNRLYYDQVDFKELIMNENSEGSKIALEAISDYFNELKKRNILDFSMLESKFLNWLSSGKLDIFLKEIKIVLIDEYQDTNLLQEKIYFKLAESALSNGGNVTVVGDDDQSLYRFRGATVDLFTNFIERAKKQLNIDVIEVNLSHNYRSSEDIVNLCNRFVELDEDYQSARVKEKPKIEFSRVNNEDFADKEQIQLNKVSNQKSVPVLGMFRQNQEILAKDLSILIKDLTHGKNVKKKIKRVLKSNKSNGYNDLKDKAVKNEFISLKLDEKEGSPSDIAILTYSPKEMSYGNQLFPYYLRKNLMNFKNPVEVFNPRGQDLQALKSVGVFCGLILECIDPEAKFQKSIKKIPKLAERNMNKWRKLAIEYITTNPEPVRPVSLEDFVNCWKTRRPFAHNPNIWPDNASLIELAYKLITWIDELQEDTEGVVYLEAIAQTITQTGFFNEYSAQIHFKNELLERNSVQEAIWNIFVPIATGGVSIDENLLDTLPNNRINIMSIHQSKGLEFPLVIVDVGSRFQKNRVKTSFLRFPKEGGKSSNLEDKIRPYSPLGTGDRDPKDRAFDDLTRLYFVAFSRAQDVLLLVGLNSAIDGYIANDKEMKIPNIALGWKRDEEFIGFDEIYLI